MNIESAVSVELVFVHHCGLKRLGSIWTINVSKTIPFNETLNFGLLCFGPFDCIHTGHSILMMFWIHKMHVPNRIDIHCMAEDWLLLIFLKSDVSLNKC